MLKTELEFSLRASEQYKRVLVSFSSQLAIPHKFQFPLTQALVVSQCISGHMHQSRAPRACV